MLSTHVTYRRREWIWKAARKRTWTSKAVTSPLCDLKNKSCDPWGQMLKWKTVSLWFLSLVLLTWLTCSISSVTAGNLSGIVFSHRPPTAPPKQSQKCFELPLPFPPSGSSLQLPMALQLGWIFIEVSLIVFWGVCLLVHFFKLVSWLQNSWYKQIMFSSISSILWELPVQITKTCYFQSISWVQEPQANCH